MGEWQDRYWNSVDGLRLHYRDYAGPSDKPPILCLHGLTRNSKDFTALADRLAGQWRVIAVDFRGRGLSAPDPNPSNYHPGTYAQDVLKLLDQLGIATAVFIGTSLGGLVTMLMAATDEERIAAALLNDVGPELDEAGLDRIRGYVGVDRRWANWDEAARDMAKAASDFHPRWSHDDWLAHARRIAREEGGEVRFDYDMAIGEPFRSADPAPAQDGWPFYRALAGRPVVIVRGELSDLLTAATAERMAAEIPGAELVTVPDVGHAPMLDEPEVVEALDRMLALVAQDSAAPRSS